MIFSLPLYLDNNVIITHNHYIKIISSWVCILHEGRSDSVDGIALAMNPRLPGISTPLLAINISKPMPVNWTPLDGIEGLLTASISAT